MLINVNVLPTLYQNRKDRIMKTSMSTSGEMSIEKNGRRENKQNVCVRKRGGALRGAASAFFLPYSQYS